MQLAFGSYEKVYKQGLLGGT